MQLQCSTGCRISPTPVAAWHVKTVCLAAAGRGNASLAQLAEDVLQLCAPAETPGAGTGLVVQAAIAKRSSILQIPLSNALVVSDEPSSSISVRGCCSLTGVGTLNMAALYVCMQVTGDHARAAWAQQHGSLPQDLAEFLEGEQASCLPPAVCAEPAMYAGLQGQSVGTCACARGCFICWPAAGPRPLRRALTVVPGRP